MTADCAIVTQRREDVVRVPSSALRFNPSRSCPPAELSRLLAPGSGPGAGHGPGMAAGPSGGSAAAARPGGGGVVSRGMVARAQDRIWTLDQGKLKAMPVRAGISDGMYIEVSGDGGRPRPGGGHRRGRPEEGPRTGAAGPLMGGMRH